MEAAGQSTAYFLVGPTASGKTAVAHWIAENHNYDILSADSMLVYTGMDIGTAKPSKEMRSRARYRGIDLATPDKPFSVWEYRRYALDVLRRNSSGGRNTIVVGGTGLYVKALTDGLDAFPGSDPALRAYWSEALKQQGIEKLQEALREKSPSLYQSLKDKENPRRLIRALELADKGVGGMPVKRRTGNEEGDCTSVVGLNLPAPDLNARIDKRVVEMYRCGLMDEVRELLKKFPILSSTARQAIGYAEAADVIQERCSVDEAITRTAARTRQFAKRQRTWFRHQANVNWIEVQTEMEPEKIAGMVLQEWSKHGPMHIAE
jgi:tRNA dimethylallyltransferase